MLYKFSDVKLDNRADVFYFFIEFPSTCPISHRNLLLLCVFIISFSLISFRFMYFKTLLLCGHAFRPSMSSW